MKKSVLSLACAIGLSTMLLAGCGTTDTNRNAATGNNNGVRTHSINQGNLLADRNRISNTAEDARMRHLRGTGLGTMNTNNYNRGPDGGPTAGLNRSYGAAGTGNRAQMTSTVNALLIGDVLIVAGDGGFNTGRTGAMGMTNGATGNGANRVWQVTDKNAIKALNRLQVNLSSLNPKTKAAAIGRDLGFVLKHVKSTGQGTGQGTGMNNTGAGMSNPGTEFGPGQMGGSIR